MSLDAENSKNEVFSNVNGNASFQHRMRFKEATETKPIRNDTVILLHCIQTSSNMPQKSEVEQYDESVTL